MKTIPLRYYLSAIVFPFFAISVSGGPLDVLNPAGSYSVDINTLGRTFSKLIGNLPLSAINTNAYQYTLSFDQAEYPPTTWPNSVYNVARVRFDAAGEFGRDLEVTFTAPNANWWAVYDASSSSPSETSGTKSLALRGTLTYTSGVYCTFSEAMGEVAFSINNVLAQDSFTILFYEDSARTVLLKSYAFSGGGSSTQNAEHILIGHRDTVAGIRCIEFRLTARDPNSGSNRALDDLSFVPLRSPGGVVENKAFPAVIVGWSEAEKQRQRDAAKQLKIDLAAAIQRGDATFVIKPDDYRFGASDCLNMSITDAQNLMIEAGGATFWLKPDQMYDGLLINNCQNLTLRGLSIDYSEAPYIQGEILQKTSGPSAKTIDIRIDEGFPLPDANWASLNASIGTFFIKADHTAFVPIRQDWVAKDNGFQSLGGRDYRITLQSGWPLRLDPLIQSKTETQPGDYMVLPLRLWRHAISINGTTGLKLEEVTIYATPHMAISEIGGIGANQYLNCSIVRRPSTGRLIAANYDAFHSIGVKNGPKIDNCHFSWVCDDIINIHSMVYPVIEDSSSRSGAIIYCHYLRDDIKIGSRLEFYEYGTLQLLAAAEVASMVEISTGSYPAGGFATWRDRALNIPAELRALGYTGVHDFIGTPSTSGAAWLVSFVAPIGVDLLKYTLVVSDNSNAADTIITNNNFHYATSTGIQLKCDGATVEGNEIKRVAYSGILLAPSLSFWEGPFPRDVVISDNLVQDCGYGYLSRMWFDYNGAQGAVSVSCPGSYAHSYPIHGIEISSNLIEGTSSNAIFLGMVSDSMILGNEIRSAGRYFPVSSANSAMTSKANPIYMRNSLNIYTEENINLLPVNQCLGKPLVGSETSLNIGPQL